MSEPTVVMPGAAAPSVLFTEAAAQKVRTLLEEETNQNLKLRVFVTGASPAASRSRFRAPRVARPRSAACRS